MLATVAIVLLVKYTVHCIYMLIFCFLFHNYLLLALVVNKDNNNNNNGFICIAA